MAKSPVTPKLITVNWASPVLNSATGFGALVVFTSCAPKASEVGETEPIATPQIPVRLIVCGLSLALSVIVTLPVRVPSAVGVKVTEMLQLPPAGTDVPQLLVSAKSPPFAPVTLMDVMVKVALPVLVNLETCGVLVVPTAWLPKLRLGGVSFTTADDLAILDTKASPSAEQ